MPTPSNPPRGLLDLLIEEKVISSSAADKVRARARDAWLPVGKILRQRGHLTMGQLMDLLQMQTAEPHLRLGELAVRQGFCTEDDVQETLRIQRETSLHPLEILLGESELDRERLMKVVVRYVRDLEAHASDSPGARR